MGRGFRRRGTEDAGRRSLVLAPFLLAIVLVGPSFAEDAREPDPLFDDFPPDTPAPETADAH